VKSPFTADERHVEVEVAYHCAQLVRSAYHQTSHTTGRRIAIQVLDTLLGCPIPEIARLGRTLKQWRTEFLGYFDTGGANNGGTEAVNGLIELHRRIPAASATSTTTDSHAPDRRRTHPPPPQKGRAPDPDRRACLLAFPWADKCGPKDPMLSR